MDNAKYDSSILVAMEMLMNFSKFIDDISKLKIIIPYFMNNLRKKNYTIKIASLNNVFELFYSMDYTNMILPVTEYNYFHAYIFPSFLFHIYQNNELILDFFNNLEKIIELEKIFLNITLKSRIHRFNEKINIEANDENKIKKKNEKNKKNIISEFFVDYDTNLEEFKNNLFKIISDVIGGRNEIDLLIIVIRKLPILLELFEKTKSNDFNMFILNNFNKTSWELQKEALIQIPKMIKIFGHEGLINYIMPCIESLITNNSDEFKIIELIKTVNGFLDTNYLPPYETAIFFNKLIPFFLHPNINIRYHIIQLLQNILSKLTPEEAFIYLFESINKYADVPILELKIDNLKNNLTKSISRVRYQLELENINYEIFNNYECLNILPLIKDYIELCKRGNKMALEDIINKNLEEKKAMENEAGLKAEEIDFVNAHGTGTKVNDRVESAVLTRVFGDGLRFQSTTGLTGHTLGAAGAIELIFSELMLREKRAAASVRYEHPSDEIPVSPLTEPAPAAGNAAVSTSLAFGGSNTALAVRRIRETLPEFPLKEMYIGAVSCLMNGEPDRDALMKLCRKYALRRPDRLTQLALSAADVLTDVVFSDGHTALITVTSYGPACTTCRVLDDILDYPEEEILPTGFSHSVVNAAASYIAASLKIHGPTFALAGFEDPFFEAADLARVLLSCGQCRRVLIVAADENSLISDAAERTRTSSFPQYREGACALMLTADPAGNRFGRLDLSEKDRGQRLLPCGIPADFPEKIMSSSPGQTVVMSRLSASGWKQN